MPQPIISRLTARCDHLRALDDVNFCRQLESYLSVADSDRAIRRILKALREEAAAAASDFAALDRTLTRELVAIRGRLVAAAPEIGPDTDPSEPDDQLRHRDWVMDTISGFDQQARAPEPKIGFAPLPYYSAQSNPVEDSSPLPG